MNNDTKAEERLTESLEQLDKDVKVLDKDLVNLNKSHSFLPTFGRGIVGSLGAIIGATLVIWLILYVLRQLAVVPVVGDTFDFLLHQLQNRPTP